MLRLPEIRKDYVKRALTGDLTLKERLNNKIANMYEFLQLEVLPRPAANKLQTWWIGIVRRASVVEPIGARKVLSEFYSENSMEYRG